jgi:hypothetical protein
VSRMTSTGMEPSSERASIHNILLSAAVTLARCSGPDPISVGRIVLCAPLLAAESMKLPRGRADRAGMKLLRSAYPPGAR